MNQNKKGGEKIMINFNVKLGTAVAVATFAASVLAPAGLADTVVDTTNNGAFSNNTVNVSNNSNITVNQTNSSVIGNTVNASSSTGGNKSNHNVGGTSDITTGPADTTVNVTIGGSSNHVTLPSCECAAATDIVTTDGNGDFSKNKTTITNKKTLKVGQSNGSVIGNTVNASSKTGKNKSNYNTGEGSSITTNSATTNVTVKIKGSKNVLN